MTKSTECGAITGLYLNSRLFYLQCPTPLFTIFVLSPHCSTAMIELKNRLIRGSICFAILQATEALVVPRSVSDFHKIGTQDDLFPFLAGDGPYFSYPGDYGIPVELPTGCKLSQVQLLARHGERYPTKNKAKKLSKTWGKLQEYSKKFNGSLSFLNEDYRFFIESSDVLEMETTTTNSVNAINPYTGEMDAKKHAQEFLALYGELLDPSKEFAVFAASSQRVHDTAKYFIESLGSDYNISLQVVSEEPESGANNLSPGYSCPAWDADEFSEITDSFSTDYLKEISIRLNNENKGLNLTSSDATNLFAWCAFELNARGFSDVCNIFTREEFLNYAYQDDLESYYQDGPGNPMIQAVGTNLFNASVELLKQSEELSQRAWLSFTHDTDILNYLTTIGLFDDGKKLNATHVPFRDHVFHKSWMIPQGARVYTQKFQCQNDSYVRYVVNDAVIPIESCSSGPGFSCEIEEFYQYAEQRMAGQDFFKVCNTSSVSNVTDLTFYWDWETKNYNSTLLKA
ncbi:LAQU0S08e00166g1_1 [Lachancea quebecensis]|uniref:acid phosphatase n=1 Tax=Lachancea quebecensis TaxID=1654605 RepID=A0A0P1KUW5_9SACH|nr:LAQU0S08e00166g1_1 [Lachancea quebecensis]